LTERVVVATNNWMFRFAPFCAFAAFLVMPAIVIAAGRHESRDRRAQTLRADSFVWCGFGVAVTCIPQSLISAALHAPLFSLFFVVSWLGVIFWVMAAVSTYALLTVSGHKRPGLLVLVASLFGGPVGLLVLNTVLGAEGYWTRRTGAV
jgi:hypothetical protein